MNARERLEATMRRHAPGQEWQAAAFDEGMTNTVWKVRIGANPPVVVHTLMPDAGASEIGIVRSMQLAAIDVAHSLGIAPGTIARYDDLGVIISQFAPGDPFPADGVLRSRAIENVGRALARLHAYPAGDEFANPNTVPFSGAWSVVDRARAASPSRFAEIAHLVDPLETIESWAMNRDMALIHNDLVATNILVGESTAIIDWEYCGLGDPYSDLGDFAAKCGLGVDEENLLLGAYLGRHDDEVLAWLRVYRYLNMLREGCWGLTAETVGRAELDYRLYADGCFADVERTIASPEFAEAMRLLSHALGSPAPFTSSAKESTS
jgi:hypothetical protein